MLLHDAGLLHGMENNFLRVVQVDMTAPDTLTRDEQLLILRHNIAWENYLLNYTNFIPLLASIENFIPDIDHIESLFPLPSQWPWVVSPMRGRHIVTHVHENDLRPMWNAWRQSHEALYDAI